MTVQNREIDTLIVGGGQAGIAMSEHLTAAGVVHLVLEKQRIAEAWRTRRWDSLVANGPAWHDRFPMMTFPGADPDSFVTRQQVVDYMEAYATKIAAPIRTGVEITRVARRTGHPGFRVETSDGTLDVRRVVVATGPFQEPVIPAIAPSLPSLHQIHSASYKNPLQLPPGGVLVVGAGSSGVQIADELQRAGRQVWLSVGPHDRPPRTYRQRDYCWWLGVLGLWDQVSQPGQEHVTIAVSGADGGHTVDFRRLAARGITLLGRTSGFNGGVAALQNDLALNIRRGDENYLSLLNAADEWIVRNGLDLPPEQQAHVILADPPCMTHPILMLDLAQAQIGTIIWATGFTTRYDWLQVDAFDKHHQPLHQRGISAEPGIYFLGLPWLSHRGSSFIWGVWHDAKFIADHIASRHKYEQYQDATQRTSVR